MSNTIPEAVIQRVAVERAPSATPSGNRAKVLELAREFEAMMTRQVLQQMRQAMTDDDAENGFGAATMTETVDMELARLLAGGKGFGMADALTGALERQTTNRPADADAKQAFAPTDLPALAAPLPGYASSVQQPHAPALPLPVGSVITSHFGSRQDPFGAGEKFHRGIDIATASGSQVPTVADGRVTFAGESGAYGNTVVVQHANGTSTRYAHLAAISVHEGEALRTGVAVGLAGSTGRSTGPHLHFEVLQNGRPVDPELVAARYGASLKNLSNVAD